MAVRKMKLKIGTVYQKEEGGIYYFRYQVKGARKAISLKTRNKQEAVREAEKLVPLLQATSSEVIAAHVQHARNMVEPEKNLLLSQAWDVYERSPERATPDTVSEALAYKSTFNEFITWVNNPEATIRDITSEMAARYADDMRHQNIAVTTHNRKIKRIRRVFKVLREYWNGENPFGSQILLRKEREDRERDVYRLSFTREQEQQKKKRVMHIVGGKSCRFTAYSLAEHVFQIVLCGKSTEEILVEVDKLQLQITGENGVISERPHPANGIKRPYHQKRHQKSG